MNKLYKNILFMSLLFSTQSFFGMTPKPFWKTRSGIVSAVMALPGVSLLIAAQAGFIKSSVLFTAAQYATAIGFVFAIGSYCDYTDKKNELNSVTESWSSDCDKVLNMVTSSKDDSTTALQVWEKIGEAHRNHSEFNNRTCFSKHFPYTPLYS